MNKEKLFYLVAKGTDVRVNVVMVVTAETAKCLLAAPYTQHEMISVTDYEKKFGMKRTKPEK